MQRYGFWNLQYHPFQFPHLLQPVPIPCRWVASRWETCRWNVKTHRLFGKRWLIDSDIYVKLEVGAFHNLLVYRVQHVLTSSSLCSISIHPIPFWQSCSAVPCSIPRLKIMNPWGFYPNFQANILFVKGYIQKTTITGYQSKNIKHFAVVFSAPALWNET